MLGDASPAPPLQLVGGFGRGRVLVCLSTRRVFEYCSRMHLRLPMAWVEAGRRVGQLASSLADVAPILVQVVWIKACGEPDRQTV